MLTESEVITNIKNCRKKSGFTTEDVGKLKGISRQRVSYIENHPFEQKVITLKEYADLYKVPVCVFFMASNLA